MNSTIRLIVIEQDSDPDVKFEVFEHNELQRDLAKNSAMLKIMGATQP